MFVLVKLEIISAELTGTHQDGYVASNCIDGNTSTMCHGDSSTGDTLTLQIAHSKVEMVRIYNRPGYENRLNNAKVKVDGQDCNTISADDVTAGKTKNNVIDVKCATPLEGTIVTVTTSAALNLMEVEVYGTRLDFGMISSYVLFIESCQNHRHQFWITFG